ncbi:unnamed protein product [Blepharisma stoltei]|uniref:RING-type domain-containing protein n=1 Tax=Blepharisma stoltei TaxID=1481888 RepID=A0AAU9K0B1_9CILI|nr:unnamed protein product [Blepharisma stoltei]
MDLFFIKMIFAFVAISIVSFAFANSNITITPLSIDSSISQNQSETWAYFQIKDYGSFSLYLSVSIELTEPAYVCLGIKENGLPEVITGYPQFDWLDIDNWNLGSKKHNVIISPYQYALSSLFVGVYLKTSIEIAYTITALQFVSQPCINNCTGNGLCAKGKCNCNSGNIGKDCQVVSKVLDVNDSQNISTEPGSITYADYGEIDSKTGENIDVIIHSYDSPITVCVKPSQINWTTTLPSKSVCRIRLNGTDIKYTISSDDYMTYFAIINTDSNIANLQIMLIGSSSGDSSKEIIFISLITVCSAVVLGWISFAIYKTRKRFQVISYRSENYLNRALEIKDIENHFPEKQIRQIDIDKGSISCPICLDNFNLDDIVRELLCDHIYHKKCIDEWFATKTYCCLCKREYKNAENLDLTRAIEETVGINNSLGLMVGANEESQGIITSNPVHEEHEEVDATFRLNSPNIN